jgi:hypothetical protein
MTEEEAKTKTCHKTLVPLLNATGSPGPCIGSACMAWRWQHIPEMYRYRDIHGNQQLGTKEGAQSTTDGYCGLAGKP